MRGFQGVWGAEIEGGGEGQREPIGGRANGPQRSIDWMASIGSQEGIRAADVRAVGLRQVFAARNYHFAMDGDKL